jgi:hypothetical protein
VELYLHSPTTPSWRGAQLGGAQGQLYLYLLPGCWRESPILENVQLPQIA